MKNSLAISYAMKRKAQHKAKGGAMHGGGCTCPSCCNGYADGEMVDPSVGRKSLARTAEGFFEKMKSPTPKTMSQEEKNESIRAQNKKNAGYSLGGEVHNPRALLDESEIKREMESDDEPHEMFQLMPTRFNKSHVAKNASAEAEDNMKLNQRKVDMHASTDMLTEDLVDRIMRRESKDYSQQDRYALGGEVGGTLSNVSYENDEQSLVDRIMYKRHGLKNDFSDLDRYSEGGKVGGAKTSTTGNKTKTGGSNPGGASTGGAGTVTITTGKIPPKGINISNVGGKTAARNAGGMDPSDEEDSMMMSEGGRVANDTGTGQGADELPNQFDDLVLRDDLESTYGDYDNAGDARGNDQEDDDRKDIVARIMASRRKKDRLPNLG